MDSEADSISLVGPSFLHQVCNAADIEYKHIVSYVPKNLPLLFARRWLGLYMPCLIFLRQQLLILFDSSAQFWVKLSQIEATLGLGIKLIGTVRIM